MKLRRRPRDQPHIPQDIVEEILTWVPTKPLMRFRCISKHFNTLLTRDTKFGEEHFSRTAANDDNHGGFVLQIKKLYRSAPFTGCGKPVIKNDYQYYYVPNGAFRKAVKLDCSYIPNFVDFFVGSSNGLICLSDSYFTKYGQKFYLCNPATRGYKTLPQPPIISQMNRELGRILLGFGFHPTINDYRVVRLVAVSELQVTKVDVYSLKSDSWRDVGAFAYNSVEYRSSLAVLNGVLHWTGASSSKSLILGFNLADEVIREIGLPEKLLHSDNLHLRPFQGCLSIIAKEFSTWKVWVMKEYGVKESWTKLYRIKSSLSLRPLDFHEDGKILFENFPNKLASYNPKSKKLSNIDTGGVKMESCWHVELIPYVHTLVSVTGYSEVGETQQPDRC